MNRKTRLGFAYKLRHRDGTYLAGGGRFTPKGKIYYQLSHLLRACDFCNESSLQDAVIECFELTPTLSMTLDSVYTI